jgi:hypothetical protein
MRIALHIRIGKEHRTIDVAPEQFLALKNVDIIGRRFVELGDRHYNVASIDYWWADIEVEEGLDD